MRAKKKADVSTFVIIQLGSEPTSVDQSKRTAPSKSAVCYYLILKFITQLNGGKWNGLDM